MAPGEGNAWPTCSGPALSSTALQLLSGATEARTGSGACVLMWGISNVAATGLTGELVEPHISHAPIKSESVGWGQGNQGVFNLPWEFGVQPELSTLW